MEEILMIIIKRLILFFIIGIIYYLIRMLDNTYGTGFIAGIISTFVVIVLEDKQ